MSPAVLALIVLLLLGSQAHGEGELRDSDQRKSMVLATVLALDPFPATALFYSGERGQAIGNGALGLAGVGLMGGSVGVFLSTSWWNSGGNSATELAIAGIATYAVALAWDGIGGIYYTRKHNRRVERREYAVQPHFMVDEERVGVGLRVSF